MNFRACEQCGDDFLVRARHPNQKFCTRLCAKRNWNQLNHDKMLESARRYRERRAAKESQ